MVAGSAAWTRSRPPPSSRRRTPRAPDRSAVRRHRATSTDADRGFIAALEPCVVKAADGRVVWDNDVYAFLAGDAPTTVHPSLWRQSQLAAKQGLYEVVEGIYQVRGLDLSNISFIEGDTGVIVIDPLVSTETAAAALALYRAHRGDRPVVAVIYTHSHVDHFGGVLGVTTPGRRRRGQGRDHRARGLHRARRAGERLRRARRWRGAPPTCTAPCWRADRRGRSGCGLGQDGVDRRGGADRADASTSATTGETHTIDGVEIEFQMAPGTEAPAEMHFYFPKFRALCMAENATHNLHNLLTLRGALVRDPHGWSGYLTEAIDTFADRADVVFASHHWPTWGKDRIVEFLSLQRDLYAYLHDQTLRQLNQGYTGIEIAENVPDAARAGEGVAHPRLLRLGQPQRQGGLPALHGLVRRQPRPAVAAPAGGDRAALRRGDGRHRPRRRDSRSKAFDDGDFRWAATLLDHAIFTDEDHAAARALYADTLEQLAYGAENAVWRNFFLSGATELREGNFGTPTQTASPSMLAQLTPEQMFDTLRDQRQRPARVGSGPRHRRDVRRRRDQLPADAAQRRAGAPQGARRRVDRARRPSSWRTRCGCWPSPPVTPTRLGWRSPGMPTRCRRSCAVLDRPDPGFNIVAP